MMTKEKENFEEREHIGTSLVSEIYLDSLGALGVTIRVAMAGMTTWEIEVIAYRFGLTDGTAHTLEKTAEKFGISRERLHQIERKMLRVGHCCRRKTQELREYLES